MQPSCCQKEAYLLSDRFGKNSSTWRRFQGCWFRKVVWVLRCGWGVSQPDQNYCQFESKINQKALWRASQKYKAAIDKHEKEKSRPYAIRNQYQGTSRRTSLTAEISLWHRKKCKLRSIGSESNSVFCNTTASKPDFEKKVKAQERVVDWFDKDEHVSDEESIRGTRLENDHERKDIVYSYRRHSS